MRFIHFKAIFCRLLIVSAACWASSMKAIFVDGLGVVKEAAEILSKTVATFPTRQVAIAIIGFIAVSQGLFFFTRGLASLLCGDSYRPDGVRAGHTYGLIQCLIGIGLSTAGAQAHCIVLKSYNPFLASNQLRT